MMPGPRQIELFLAALICVLVPLVCSQSTIYVSSTGSNNPTCGLTVETACANISFALVRRARDDTTVSVFPGTYYEVSSRLASFSSLNIVGSSAFVSCVDRNGPLFAFSGVSANISGLIISNCQDNDGGAIQIMQRSTIAFHNVSISNVEGFRGGAILVAEGSSLDASALTISNSKASFYGGAVLVCSGATMTWSKGSVRTTHSTSGGAVAVLDGGLFVGSDIQVSGADTFGLAYGVGGFLFANSSTAKITRLNFVGGTAGYGAAVAAVDGAQVAVSSSNFTSLVSANAGGAIWAAGEGTVVSVEQCNFVKNSAGIGGGGAIMISGGARLSVSGSLFSANAIGTTNYKDSAPGGAIFVTNHSSLVVRDSAFQKQKLYDYFGAGIAALGNLSNPTLGPEVTVLNCIFADNEILYSYSQITYHGGVGLALVATSNAHVQGCSFVRNKIGSYSSAGTILVHHSSNTTLMDSSFHLNSGGAPATAGYFVGGGLLRVHNVSVTNSSCGISCSPGLYFELAPKLNSSRAIWNVSRLSVLNNQRGDYSTVIIMASGPGNSTFTMKNSNIENNYSGGLGISQTRDQLPMYWNSKIEVSDSNIARHRNNGAAYVASLRASLVFRNVSFSYNTAKSGAGLYLGDWISNGLLIDSCSAFIPFHSLIVFPSSYVSRTEFIGNVASEDGGGVTLKSGTALYPFSLNISNCLFEGNMASKYGGGLAVVQGALPNITGTVFRGNTAGNCGGGIAVYRDSNPWIQDSIIADNVAPLGGGACAIAYSLSGQDGSDLTALSLVRTRIVNNTALRSGGGLYLNNILGTKYQQRPVVLDNVSFEANRALGNQSGGYYGPRDGGGAIYCRMIWSSKFMTNLRFVNNSAPNTPLTHHLASAGCGQLATFNCDQCSASNADCVLSGDSYGGRCSCTSSELDSTYCTPKSDPIKCFGESSSSPTVCSGQGRCIGPDQCYCNLDRAGQACQAQRVELKVALPSAHLPFINCTDGLCPSIQSAIWFIQNFTSNPANAGTGFLISLSEGTFNSAPISLPVNSNLRGLGSGASIVGTRGTYYALLSVGNSDNWTPAIRIENIELSNSTSGLTVSSGVFWFKKILVHDMVPLSWGGGPASGISISGGRVVIEDSEFFKCAAIGVGAISVNGAQVTIRNTEVAYNYQWAANGYPTGLGLAMRGGCGQRFQNCYQGESVIVNSYFHHQKDGPSIGVDGGARIIIINSTVSDNLSSGVSIGISYSAAPVYPELFISNSAFLRNAGSGVFVYTSKTVIEKSLFAFNNNTAIFILQAGSLALRDLKVINNTSANDDAAGISLHGITGVIVITELARLSLSGNNGSRWGNAGGLSCMGPNVPSSPNSVIRDIYLDDNFTYLPRGSPNLQSWNSCGVFPQGKNCTSCALVGSHCIVSSSSCSCQPGWEGPNCAIPQKRRW